MKISLTWLKDYMSIGISKEMLAHKLTMAGFEVEKILTVDSDTVFELEITPNRPDCLNMLGMARELSAILNKTRRSPKIQKLKIPNKKCNVEIVDKEGCLRYVGTLMEGVTISDAPSWMTKRLSSLGIRPINNVVDITNFCLLETGQPLHAFDYDKLIGGNIIARRANPGETIVTIDGVKRQLDETMLVIADEKRPVALAGIMGSKDTEVTSQTKNVLLESAYFNPILIRRAARKAGLSSDSSYRFERGVDFDMVSTSSGRASSLILECAGGKITKRTDRIVGKPPQGKRSIQITVDQINKCLGAVLTGMKCKNILKKLDFEVEMVKKDTLKIITPSFRGDIKDSIDIIEEIARIIGYDHLPESLPQVKFSSMPLDVKRQQRKCLRDLLVAQGFSEIVTYSMINQKSLEKTFQEDLKGMRIQNPLTHDQEIMRPAMLPSHVAVVRSNMNHGQKDLKFFEMGRIYTAGGEKETLALTMTGFNADDWRKTKKDMVGFYDLKGAVEQILERAGIREIVFDASEKSFLERGQSACVLIGGQNAGVIGKIQDDLLKQWDIKHADVFFGEIDLEQIYQKTQAERRYESIPEYPSITRDMSLAIPLDVTAGRIEDQIRKAVVREPNVLLGNLKFIEEYRGDKVSGGYRGMTFSLTYQARQARTLRDDEVVIVHEKVWECLTKELGAVQR